MNLLEKCRKERSLIMTTLGKDPQKLLSFVSKHGCVDTNQIYKLMRPMKDKLIQTTMSMLLNADYLNIVHDHYLVVQGHDDEYDRDVVNCIWAMLKLVPNPEDVFDSIKGNSPAKIFVTSEGKHSFELIPLQESTVHDIRKIQEKIVDKQTSTRKLSFNWPVFVVTNKDVIRIIKSSALKFPFIVAYIESFDQYGIPSIKVLKSIPKDSK